MSHKITIKFKIELAFEQPTCSICGQPIKKKKKMSLDHYIPRCHGGKDEASNLFPAHSVCNSIKNDYMPDEFEKNKEELYQNALDNWHLKHKDKLIVADALRQMQKKR